MDALRLSPLKQSSKLRVPIVCSNSTTNLHLPMLPRLIA